MKAAVLNSCPGDLEIEEVAIDKPGPREVLVRTVRRRPVPQRPPLHGGASTPPRCRSCSATSRPASSRPSAIRSPTSSPATTSSPASRSSAATASTASPGAPVAVPEPRDPPADGRCGRGSARPDGAVMNQFLEPVVVRRADARARARHREDPQGHAARPRRPHRLRRHHRPRRGVQHRQGRARRDRRRHRLRRHRPQRHPGRLHRRRRRGSSPSTCSPRSSSWPRRSAPPTWSTPRDGDAVAAGDGADRRRRALRLRGHRPEGDGRAGVRRCCARAAPPRSSA